MVASIVEPTSRGHSQEEQKGRKDVEKERLGGGGVLIGVSLWRLTSQESLS